SITTGDREAALDATFIVHHPRVFRRAMVGGMIALGESYMDGEWTSPDLLALLRLVLRNMAALDEVGGIASSIAGIVARAARTLRDNTQLNSRRNIRRHYDLGNEFFSLFLDANLLYSCALFEDQD